MGKAGFLLLGVAGFVLWNGPQADTGRSRVGIEGRYLPRDGLEILMGLDLPGAILIEYVQSGTPAHKAGLRGGHTPGSVDGEEILTGGDLILSMDLPEPCRGPCLAKAPQRVAKVERLSLTYLRNGELKRVTLDLGPVASRTAALRHHESSSR